MEYTNQVIRYCTERPTFGMLKKRWVPNWLNYREERVLIRNLGTGAIHNRPSDGVVITAFLPIIDIG